jgi:hypothetical protein
MARLRETYRSERRNYARRRKLVWRGLERLRTNGRRGWGALFVVVPGLKPLTTIEKPKGGVR